jgi:putative cell wall-binding protein
MIGGSKAHGLRKQLAGVLATAVTVVGLLLTVTAPARGETLTSREAVAAARVQPASLSGWQAGNIVSDSVFFASNTMSQTQIQSFLQQKVPVCQAGYTCLKDWYDTSRNVAADAMCGAYSGGYSERASQIIFKVAQACGVNPQVLLVTMQKEQGLVTHTWPSTFRFTLAMGQGCPDTAACDSQYYGFFNQVYGAAHQFKRYANPPGTSQYFTWYAPGHTWNILYNPNRACGTSPVYVQNQATANLYYYTPYQPDSAALAAGYGTGDGCSSYGNRNFYNYFTDWFGSTQVPSNVCSPPPDSQVSAAGGEYTVNVTSLNGRKAPTTDCGDGVVNLAQGTIVTRTGVFGTWWRVRLNGQILWVASDYLTSTPPVTYTTSRLAGANRYATAAAIAEQSNPNGAGTVYLASGENFPDALSGSALAAQRSAPLLLTAGSTLPSETASALTALGPHDVIILGGTSSVSDAVADAVGNLLGAGVVISRIAGADRYATSLMIVQEGWTSAATVYLATGRGFADALSASGVAGGQGFPVVLVDGAAASIPSDVLAELKTLATGTVIIAGGTQAVSAAIATQIAAAGLTVNRMAGADRFQTSAVLSASVAPSSSAAFVASGYNFPDALAGSVLAASKKAPLLTTPGWCMAGVTKDYLVAHGTSSVTVLGGPQAMSDSILASSRC